MPIDAISILAQNKAEKAAAKKRKSEAEGRDTPGKKKKRAVEA